MRVAGVTVATCMDGRSNGASGHASGRPDGQQLPSLSALQTGCAWASGWPAAPPGVAQHDDGGLEVTRHLGTLTRLKVTSLGSVEVLQPATRLFCVDLRGQGA